MVLVISLLSFLAAGCGSNSPVPFSFQPPQHLEDGLDVGALDEAGVDMALLAEAVDGIKNGRYHEIHSLLIYKNDHLVLEECFPGHDYKWDGPNFHGDWVNWGPDRRHNIHFTHAGKKIPSYWATGFVGQKIIIFPDLDAVVVFTSGNYNMASTNAEILNDFIIPAFEQE